MAGSRTSRASDTKLPRQPFEQVPVPARPNGGPAGVDDTAGIARDNKWVKKAGDTMSGALKIDGSAAAVSQLVVEGAAAQTGDLITCQNSSAGVLAKVASGGKITCVDADTGFVDSNGHYQGPDSRLNALLTELGYVLKEETRSWLPAGSVFSVRLWNQPETFFSSGDMFGRSCPDGADTTIGHKVFRVPTWYTPIAGGVTEVDVYWMADTIPGGDQVVRVRVETDAGFNVGDTVPAVTVLDTSVNIGTAHTVRVIRKHTVTVTTPIVADGKLLTRFSLRRRASAVGDTADTYAGVFWVVGIDVRSGVSST